MAAATPAEYIGHTSRKSDFRTTSGRQPWLRAFGEGSYRNGFLGHQCGHDDLVVAHWHSFLLALPQGRGERIRTDAEPLSVGGRNDR